MSEVQNFDAMIDDPFKDDEVNEYAAQIENPFELEDLTLSDDETDFGDLKVDFIKALILDDDTVLAGKDNIIDHFEEEEE